MRIKVSEEKIFSIGKEVFVTERNQRKYFE